MPNLFGISLKFSGNSHQALRGIFAVPFGWASDIINIIITIAAVKNTATVTHRMAEIMKVSSVD